MSSNNLCIISIFSGITSRHAGDIAVADADTSLTYDELDRLSDIVAASIPEANGMAVGVLVPRCKEIIIGAVAALKAGGIFMPMDDAYPKDRIEYMLRDSAAGIILTTKSLWAEKHIDFPMERVRFFEDFHLSAVSDATFHTVEKSADDAAMILYTSGTTGNPKGVVHTNKSVAACAAASACASNMKPGDNIAIMAGFTFIASEGLIMMGLLHGGTLHIVDSVTRQDTGLLHTYFSERHIAISFLPPALATAMVEEYDMSAVRILSAGDKLRNFKPKYPCHISNVFGSTEGSLVLAAPIKGDEAVVPLGKPLPGIAVRIVNESMDDVAEGETGELIYSADIQAREYLNLPTQTAEKWFVDSEGHRWFRMGDRVRREADGNLYYVGRTDNMVKIRGFRVETGEVERQISQAVPSVEVAVVMRNVHGIDHLVCFYEGKEEIDVSAVKTVIEKSLAEYMIPDIWIRLGRLPRNANGKVVRRELPTPASATDKLSVIFNEVEMRIVEAAKLIVGETISLDDNFFECGGTSLGAIRLATQLKTMGIHITGSKIMELKVLRLVAEESTVDYERLWTPEQYREICNSYASRGETIQKVLPLSTEHEDVLLRYLMRPDSTAYRNVFLLKLDSLVNEHILRDAISYVSDSYEVLRSSIAIHHKAPFQQIITDRRIPLDVFSEGVSKDDVSKDDVSKDDVSKDDVSKDDVFKDGAKEKIRYVKNLYQHYMHTPYDPETSSLMRIGYVPLSDGTSFLLVLVHNVSVSINIARHAIHDIMESLCRHYPEDVSIEGWRDLTELALKNENHEEKSSSGVEIQKPTDNGLIRTYTPLQKGLPSVTFVHTGNTGSDAYYRLADKIGEFCSFAVLEPYNLFHQNDIQHGIKAIAKKYVEILLDYQPSGPYILGGWCYGGVVAHEMACCLQAMGKDVRLLIMFDSHALASDQLTSMAKEMQGSVNREYFETCPLFEDLRGQGLLEAMVSNSTQVCYDLLHHTPSVFHGPVTYFKPMQTPMAATGKALEYWQKMMEFDAGNYENFCDRNLMEIINTPHEHDLMMDDESLVITVPAIKRAIDKTF